MKKVFFYALTVSALVSVIACTVPMDETKLSESDGTGIPVVTVSPTGVPEPTKRPNVMPDSASDKPKNNTPDPMGPEQEAGCTSLPDLAWT